MPPFRMKVWAPTCLIACTLLYITWYNSSSEFVTTITSHITISDPDSTGSSYDPSSVSNIQILDAPEDYLEREVDDEWCQSNYGPEYLDHIAGHHLPYCTPDSASKVECFRTPSQDELCFIQGAKFDSGDVGRLHVDCQLRNFTQEKLDDPKRAEEYKDVKDVAEFKNYFFSTGAGMQLKDWRIEKQEDNSCTATDNDGKYYLLVKREGNHNLWHKLMELWQAMVTIDALQMAVYANSKLPYIASGMVPSIQVVFEDNEIGPVWDLWGMITGNSPIRRKDLPDGCLGHVILPLAGSTSPFWSGHWEAMDCKSQFMLKAFLKRIYRHLGIEPRQRKSEETVITIIDRKKSRRILHLPAYIERLKEHYPKFTIQAIDFSDLTLLEQINTIRGTDILIGVIGAGMTHLLWLPKESSIAEIMPPGTDYSGFRNLAKMRNLAYVTLHGQSHEEWNSTTAAARAGKLRDLAFNNEAEGSEASFDGFEGNGRESWQGRDIWLLNEEFQALADAAVAGQANRGTRREDVRIPRVRTKIELTEDEKKWKSKAPHKMRRWKE